MSKLSKILLISTLLHIPTQTFAKSTSCSCHKLSKSQAILTATKSTPLNGMVWVPPGSFIMGSNDASSKPDERPLHLVKLDGFYMDETEVTNEQFSKFVAKTKYITTAEKSINWNDIKNQLPPGTPPLSANDLSPGSLVFSPPKYPVPLDDPGQWWSWSKGANWKHPQGPMSKPFGNDHPVVHVSWYDANTYCQAMGKRLPTEAEREWAARGGLANKPYPWGNEDIDQGKIKANTWHGHFPYQHTKSNGYQWTSPVKTFKPNGYGLYDMAGNVWEWTSDYYDSMYYTKLKKRGTIRNPHNHSTFFDPDEPNIKKYSLRGGSFLCHKSYCSGYRVSARMKSTPDTSLMNVGFRCVKDA